VTGHQVQRPALLTHHGAAADAEVAGGEVEDPRPDRRGGGVVVQRRRQRLQRRDVPVAAAGLPLVDGGGGRRRRHDRPQRQQLDREAGGRLVTDQPRQDAEHRRQPEARAHRAQQADRDEKRGDDGMGGRRQPGLLQHAVPVVEEHRVRHQPGREGHQAQRAVRHPAEHGQRRGPDQVGGRQGVEGRRHRHPGQQAEDGEHGHRRGPEGEERGHALAERGDVRGAQRDHLMAPAHLQRIGPPGRPLERPAT
jgi:hypothetical protein